jgi:glycosyltransferase involved in cell wall biosynthesis
MRLAIFADQLLYKFPGGIGTYLRELVPEMANLKGENEYLLLHCGGQKEVLLGSLPSVEERRIPGGRSFLGVSWHYLGGPAIERFAGKVDLMHAPGLVVPASEAPPVVTIHDLAVLKFPRCFPSRWRRFLTRGLQVALNRARLLLADSESTACDLAEILREDDRRVRVIPLGVSAPKKLPEGEGERLRRKLRLPEKYLLFVGTLEPRKNLEGLLAAYVVFCERSGKDAGLVLAGAAGWGVDNLLERARDMPGVTVTGYVSGEELEAIYRGAACLVYPSLYEGFGLPVLEAMARGVPVITSDRSSLKEVASGAALLVDPHDIVGMAEAMHQLLSEEKLQAELKEAGLRRAGEYSWKRTALRTLEAYEEAVG